MKGLKTTLTMAIAVGLLAGSAVGVAAQDEAATVEPIESLVPPDTGAAVSADARVIDLDIPRGREFTQNGEQIPDIPVTPGESVLIRVDNAGGFPHNFYIGTDSQLSTPPSQEDLIAFIEAEKEAGRDIDLATLATWPTTDVGIPAWLTGVQYVEWLVPADITDLKFGCTLIAHYPLMQGTFSVRA